MSTSTQTTISAAQLLLLIDLPGDILDALCTLATTPSEHARYQDMLAAVRLAAESPTATTEQVIKWQGLDAATTYFRTPIEEATLPHLTDAQLIELVNQSVRPSVELQENLDTGYTESLLAEIYACDINPDKVLLPHLQPVQVLKTRMLELLIEAFKAEGVIK